MVHKEEHFDTLERLVLKENETVTYKTLSQILQVHVNLAKGYLLDFYTKQTKKENVSLEATYFLAGSKERDGYHCTEVMVVCQSKLEPAKNEFEKVTSCHIYSIGKSKTDESQLYDLEKKCVNTPADYIQFSAIKPSSINIRSSVLNNKVKQQEPVAIEKKNTKNSSNFNRKDENTPQTEDPVAKEKDDSSNSHRKDENTPQTEAKTQKSNSIASLWKKSEEKSKTSITSETDAKGKAKSPQKTKKLPQNNILSMFSKQSERNVKSGNKTTPANESNKIAIEQVKEKIESSSTSALKEDEQETKPSSSKIKKKHNQKQSVASKRGKKSESDEDFQPKKKHRRICTFEDSDSESECEEERDRAQRSLLQSEDPLELPAQVELASPMCDDNEDPIPPTPPVVSGGKKKILKMVQKTFQDEDGFFVTKQEKEFVSESESDEDPIPPNQSKQQVIQPNPATHKKQASLTSFFKKL